MPLITYFRTLLVLHVLLIAGEIASGQITISALPEPLRNYLELQYKSPEKTIGPNLEALSWVSLFGMGLLLSSVGGLWALWRPARIFFTAYLLCLAVAIVLAGPVVESSLTSVLAFMNTIISGLILGMIYFSPLREHFDAAEPTELNSGS
jgi:hypothetical protein